MILSDSEDNRISLLVKPSPYEWCNSISFDIDAPDGEEVLLSKSETKRLIKYLEELTKEE